MFKANEPVKGTVNDPIYDLINDPINLFDLIKENPNFSYDEYAQKLGVSSATIKRHIRELKNSGKIIRKGSNKTGNRKMRKNVRNQQKIPGKM